jgi:hypothetical protein
VKLAWDATFDELTKLGAVSDEQARAALERLDALEAAKPTTGQALRYGALGAGAGVVSRGLGDVIEHGMGGAMGKLVPGRYGAAMATGGLMAGATPMIRSALDRRAEAGKLRSYLAQPPTSITPAGVDIPDVPPKLAASAPEKNEEKGSPNLKKYLIGGGLATGGTAANLGLGKYMDSQARADVGEHTAPLFDKLKGESSTPVFENEFGGGGSMFTSRRKDLGMHGALLPGSEVQGPQVHVGYRSPSVLAHELGHAGINESRVGRLVQNRATIRAGAGAGGIGAAAGFASGAFSDDPRVHRAALAVPALASLPTLGYEAAATLSGLGKLRRGGADKAQMARALKTLGPAWGTYAVRTGMGTAAALANQGVGGAIRHKVKSQSKEKKAMDTVSFLAFSDELQKISAEKNSGFLDTVKGALTRPIPGTPELLGGAKSSVNQITRFGGKGSGASDGFKKFQAQQMAKGAAAPMAQGGAAMLPAPGGAPMLPPNPGGMNMVFAPKPRPQMMAPPGGMR